MIITMIRIIIITIIIMMMTDLDFFCLVLVQFSKYTSILLFKLTDDIRLTDVLTVLYLGSNRAAGGQG